MKNKKEKIKKSIYNFFKIQLYIVILVILLYILINITKGFKINEYEAFIVISESMKPEINSGDILIIKNVNSNEIKEGDIITFERNNEYITHRIVEIRQTDNTKVYITKGDNNLVNDNEEVYFENIKGIRIAQIPYIGLLIMKIPEQKYVIIILLILILLYKRAQNIDNRKKERRKKKKIEDGKIGRK